MKHTHTHDSSQSPAAAHTDTHRQPQSQKHRVTLLATSPSLASPPSPQVPHTKPPSPARQTLQTDRAVPGPWGAAPWPSLNPGAWGARTEEGGGGLSAVRAPPRQLGSPRDKEGGPGDLCPGTLDQAFLCVCGGVCLKFPLFYSGLRGMGSQAQRPCFEKGMFLGQRPSVGAMLCPGMPLRPGDRLCLESPQALPWWGSCAQGPHSQDLA